MNQVYRRHAEDQLREQHGHEGRQVAACGEDGGHFHEYDKSEGQRDAYGQVHAYSAACLARRDGHPDEGHHEDGQRVEQALVEFYLGFLDGAGAAYRLAFDVFQQLGRRHGLDAFRQQVEVFRHDAEVQVGCRLPVEGSV